MAKIKLTKTAVDAATAKDRDYELRDTIKFIEDYSKLHNKPSTVEGNERTIKNNVIPRFGKMKVQEITRAHISEAMTVMADRPTGCG